MYMLLYPTYLYMRDYRYPTILLLLLYSTESLQGLDIIIPLFPFFFLFFLSLYCIILLVLSTLFLSCIPFFSFFFLFVIFLATPCPIGHKLSLSCYILFPSFLSLFLPSLPLFLFLLLIVYIASYLLLRIVLLTRLYASVLASIRPAVSSSNTFLLMKVSVVSAVPAFLSPSLNHQNREQGMADQGLGRRAEKVFGPPLRALS